MLGQIGQDQVGGDRRNLIQARFTELSLNVIFRCETKSSVGLQAYIRSLPGSISREQLCHVRLSPAELSRVEESRRFVAHQICRANVSIGLGNGKLNPLILPDW